MEISLHSSKKHRALGYYINLIRDLITSPKNPFNKLYYADLYCGDGECIVGSTGKKYDPPIIQSLLRPAKEIGFSLSCFLNDLDTDKIARMKERTKIYKDFIEYCESKDANVCFRDILKMIPPDQFSIFFLDPTNHQDLKWSTIKAISEHTHHYHGKTRRPELIINLMTYTMLGSYRSKSFQSINESLGTTEWLEQVEKNKEKGLSAPIEQTFLTVFVNQLKSLGYSVPTPIKITNTSVDNTIYYLVWATNEQGYDIIETRLIPWINDLMQKAQKENKGELKKATARKRGDRSLTEYVSNQNN